MSDVQIDAQPLNQLERILDVFVSPSLTFRDVRRSASWWAPFAILALASLSLSYTIGTKVGFEQLTENQIQLSPAREAQINSLEPAARAEALRRGALLTQYISYASPVLILVAGGLAALLLWATFNFGLGARAAYREMLSVWFYASLPKLLVMLVAAVTLWFGGTAENFNPQYPAGTNLGYYLTEAPGWVRVLLSFFDVAGVWTVVLLILGTAIVARVEMGKAAAAIIGWWVLIVAGSVMATAAFS